jgi:hypothetical protein
MTEKKHEQPESDAENPSLTDAELEQVAGGAGTKYCTTHKANAPCQNSPDCVFTIVP